MMRGIQFFIITLFLFSVGCTKYVELKDNGDETPPELVLTVNSKTLDANAKSIDFSNTPMDGLIKIIGYATDNETGVQKVSVGADLKYKCAGSDEELIYSGISDLPPRRYSKTSSGEKVKTARRVTLNFRLWDMRKNCGEKTLTEAKGTLFVYGKNYIGKDNKNVYNVFFTPTNIY